MTKLTIDGIEIDAPAGSTVIQACEMAGVEIPRFCYHERLAIAGNCRMCLVEVSPGPPKPQASCALPVAENMVIKTNTPMVKKAREGVMEFLLINHPLDCPICDQAGECDLQDQAVAYGRGGSRYKEFKRSVEDKYLGPLIKTEMNRCIHCTRCIRFATEVAGVPELGATGRGEHMEITTYVEKALTSELSGNMVDLCPVGALTSKPYAFIARPWELVKTESIDVMDAVGSNIRIDSRGEAVMRVLPRLNEAVNEEWISDKTRHACDGLRRQRLDQPYLRKEGALVPASWDEAFTAIAEKIGSVLPQEIAAIAGDLACAESMTALKDLMQKLGSPHLDCRQDGAQIDATDRSNYLFNTTIAGLEEADFCLLIGTDPRHEAPIINARLRKRYLRGGFQVSSIGAATDLTYPVQWLGNNPFMLEQLAKGPTPIADILAAAKDGFANTPNPRAADSLRSLLDALGKAKKPMLILGQGALAREDGAQILSAAQQIAKQFNFVQTGWNGFNMLHTAAARVAGLDLVFVPGKDGRDVSAILAGAREGAIKFVYLLNADEIDTSRLGNAFVVYQGHHGDAGAHRADVVLPGAAYTEKEATYVNTEGRVQRTARAVFPPGEAKEDWKILRALSEKLGRTLPYDNVKQLRARMCEIAPSFSELNSVSPAAATMPVKAKGSIGEQPFHPAITHFYQTDPISRASKTMAECAAVIDGQKRQAA